MSLTVVCGGFCGGRWAYGLDVSRKHHLSVLGSQFLKRDKEIFSPKVISIFWEEIGNSRTGKGRAPSALGLSLRRAWALTRASQVNPSALGVVYLSTGQHSH